MDITIGEKVLRCKVSGGDTIEWVITTVNETYLSLIKEFPEDYKTIGQLQKENAELRKIIYMNQRLNTVKPKVPTGERHAYDGLMELYDNCMKWYDKAEIIDEESRN